MTDFNSYVDKIDTNLLRDICLRQGELCHYKKGEYFLHQGETRQCNWGFIEKGYFKYSVVDEDGNINITGFAFSHTPIGDYPSLIKNTPVTTDIIAATEADVFVCKRNIIDELFAKEPTLHRIISDEIFLQTYNRFLNMYRLSSKERYIQLLSECPNILQVITLKEIASYLQITPTHLSRIRKAITFGKK